MHWRNKGDTENDCEIFEKKIYRSIFKFRMEHHVIFDHVYISDVPVVMTLSV